MADRSRRRLALGAVWVGGTALAMTASILAIDVAGTKVTSPGSFSTAHVGQAADISGPVTTLAVAAGGSDSAGGPAPTTGTGSATAPGAGVGSSGTPTVPGRSSAGGTTPTSAGSAGGSAGPTTSTTAGSSPGSTVAPTTTVPPPPSSVQSVTVTGGTVRVQCIASSATLLADPADPGFEAEASHPSAGTIHVEFSKDPVSSEVTAVCSAGVITFHTETSTDG